MQKLSAIAVEVIASVWLIVVSVQYVSRYFADASAVDLTYTYVGMLFILVAVSAVRALRAVKHRFRRKG